jgi:hypothetical protein
MRPAPIRSSKRPSWRAVRAWASLHSAAFKFRWWMRGARRLFTSDRQPHGAALELTHVAELGDGEQRRLVRVLDIEAAARLLDGSP